MQFNKRSPVAVLLLSMVTCGIYAFYLIYQISSEVRDFRGDNTINPALELLLCIITCGLYPFFWYYGIAERMNNACLARGLRSQTNGTSFLLWYILGSFIIVGPFVAMHQLFETMNTVATEYNASRGL